MADELEYVITGALLECSEGTVPMPFQATPRNVRLQGLKVGNAADKLPVVNIPSFVICKKLTQMAGGTPVPCVPAPIIWQDTYPVQVNKQEVLIFRSCIRCSSGQGKIEFLTSGQTPVPPEVTKELEEMQKEAEDTLKEAEAEKNSVGEAGFAESFIPVWGSGRDMIHAIQTGDTFGAVLNGAFLVWDVASVVAGVFSFGAATVAMQGAKAGVKGLIKAGAKVAAKGAAKKLAALTAKSLAMKKGLLKGLTKLASTRVCMLACFPAGTSIAVEEGYRNIEELETGDRVWSRDEFTGQLALQPITHTMSRETDHLIHLRLGGERLQTTAEHPFYTPSGWQKAGTLALGQEVMRSDGQWVAITQVDHRTEFDQPVTVHNIEVANAHTYFVGKWMWWVHNATVCISKGLKTLAGKVITNSKFRGGLNPKALAKGFKVPVKANGYPNFASYLYKGSGKSTVVIEMTGKYGSDFSAANKAAGHTKTPLGYTWHHTEVVKGKNGKLYNKMELVETPAHEAARHSGGAQMYRQKTGNKKAYR